MFPTGNFAAPKRKRPRPEKYDEDNTAAFSLRNSPISSTTKAETADQTTTNTEIPSSNVEKISGSAGENGGVSNESGNSQAIPATLESHPESTKVETKPLTEESESKDLCTNKDEPQSPLKESNGPRLEDKREDMTATKS